MRTSIAPLLVGVSLSFGGLAACVENANPGAPDLGTAPRDMGCYANPTTYSELLNACTNAEAIDKRPVLPLMNADGTLPPLP